MKRKVILNLTVVVVLLALFVVLSLVVDNNAVGQYMDGDGFIMTQEEVDAQGENPLCVRKYYMHGTSHSLGIDVHDVGSDTKCFAAGQVWTVEPGI